MRTWKMAATGLAFLMACVACSQTNGPHEHVHGDTFEFPAVLEVPLIESPMKVTLSAENTSFELPVSNGDWTQFDAVRVRVVNEGGNFQLSYRVDDVTSTNFATRFNSDMPLRVNAGENELEISVAALRQGNLFSRGIDVSRVKSLRLFTGGVKEPITLNVNDVRLIKRTARGTKVVTDFAAKEPKTRIDAKDGTTVTQWSTPVRPP